MMLSAASRVAIVLLFAATHAASAQVTGLVDARLGPLLSVFNATGKHPAALTNAGTDTGTNTSVAGGALVPLPESASWHIGLFAAPATAASDEWHSYAAAASAVCLAYNAAQPRQLAASLAGIAAVLAGANASATPDAGDLAGYAFHVAGNPADPAAPSTALVLAAFVRHGVAGFDAAATDGARRWPAGVTAPGNANVRVHASEAAALAAARAAPGSVALAPFAFGVGLPCLDVAALSGPQATAHAAKLSAAVTADLRVLPASSTAVLPGTAAALRGAPVAAAPAGADAYPFTGALVVTVHANASCAMESAAAAVVSTIAASPVAEATLASWGVQRLQTPDKLAVIAAIASSLDASLSCADGESFPVYGGIGGSSVVAAAVEAWGLQAAADRGYSVSYTGDGSGSGHREVREGRRLVGGADYPTTAAQRLADPNVRVLPAVAFAAALVVNLPGVRDVMPRCLAPALLSGGVEWWDHPALVAANPVSAMPHLRVSVVARAPGSGTTRLLTTGLAGIVATCGGPGALVDGAANPNVTAGTTWPFAGATVLDDSTGGLLARVAATPGAVGYAAEASAAATSLVTVGLLDRSDNGVLYPTATAVRAAVLNGDVDAAANTVTPRAAPGVYPFVAVAYIVVAAEAPAGTDCGAFARLLEIVAFGTTTDAGAALTAESRLVPVGYRAMAERVLAAARCGGAPVFPELQPPAPAAAEADVALLAGVGSVVGVLGLLLAATGAHILFQRQQRAAALARCPSDEALPFGAVFVGVKNEAELRDAYEEVAVRSALRRLAELVSAAARASECHEARQVDEATALVVAKHPGQALEFAARVAQAVNGDEEWARYFNYRFVAARGRATGADSSRAGQSTLPTGATSTAALYRDGGGGDSDLVSGSSDVPQVVLTNGSPASHSTADAASIPQSIELHVGVSYGFGSIARNNDTGTFTYHGDVVESAAVVADTADSLEIVVTNAVVDALQEEGEEPDGRIVAMSVPDFVGASTDKDDRDRPNLFIPSDYQPRDGPFNGPSSPTNVSSRLERDRRVEQKRRAKRGGDEGTAATGRDASTGGIASALSRADGGVSRRRCAVIVIYCTSFVPPRSARGGSRSRITQYNKHVSDVLRRVSRRAATFKAHVVSVEGPRILVTVNASGDVVTTNPIARACHLALQLQADVAAPTAAAAATAGSNSAAPDRCSSASSTGDHVCPTASRPSHLGTDATDGTVFIGVAGGETSAGAVGGVSAITGNVVANAVAAQQCAVSLGEPIVVVSPLGSDIEALTTHFVTVAVDVTGVEVPHSTPPRATKTKPLSTTCDEAALAVSTDDEPHALRTSSPRSSSPPRPHICGTVSLPSAGGSTVQLLQVHTLIAEVPVSMDSEWMYTMQQNTSGGATADAWIALNEFTGVLANEGSMSMGMSTAREQSPAGPHAEVAHDGSTPTSEQLGASALTPRGGGGTVSTESPRYQALTEGTLLGGALKARVEHAHALSAANLAAAQQKEALTAYASERALVASSPALLAACGRSDALAQ